LITKINQSGHYNAASSPADGFVSNVIAKPTNESQALLAQYNCKSTEQRYGQISNPTVASHPLHAQTRWYLDNGGCEFAGRSDRGADTECLCGDQLCTGCRAAQTLEAAATTISHTPRRQTDGRHTYYHVISKDSSIQVNADIGNPQANLQRSHLYNNVVAEGRSRQINGDILDSHVFLQFMKM